MNARLWVWHLDGWVKLTLGEGQSLSTCRRYPTQEGWSSESYRWELSGGVVTHEWFTEGRDCDGYTSTEGERYCHVYALRDHACEDGTLTPAWIDAGSERRDEYAEAAGY